MKLLMENWRKQMHLWERINDLSSNKRFVLDELVVVTEDRNNVPIPPQELEKIAHIAGLSGSPNFLGSGTKGSAWKFDNKVLKITQDSSEARAAMLIKGKRHPNVYDIYYVGKRSDENIKSGTETGMFVIVYEYLYYPNSFMVEVGEYMWNRVKYDKGASFYYHWKPEYYPESKKLLRTLAHEYKNNPDLLGEPVPETGGMPGKKLLEMADKVGFSALEKRLFQIFYAGPFGMPTREEVNDPQKFHHYAQQNKNNIRLEYMDQILSGLTFLMQNGIDFHDIKTSNLMEKDNQIAIIDIGYSRVQSSPEIPLL